MRARDFCGHAVQKETSFTHAKGIIMKSLLAVPCQSLSMKCAQTHIHRGFTQNMTVKVLQLSFYCVFSCMHTIDFFFWS